MILVVDDHADTRKVLVRLLQHDGHEAIGVADGREALRFLETRIPRLVILDCDMPCLDGLGVVQAVRADERLRGLAVVMFTAETAEAVRRQVERLGVQGWVVKGSLDWAELWRLVEQYAGDGAGAHAPPGGVRTTPLE